MPGECMFRVVQIGGEAVYASFIYEKGQIHDLGFFPMGFKPKNVFVYKSDIREKVLLALLIAAKQGFALALPELPVEPI